MSKCKVIHTGTKILNFKCILTAPNLAHIEIERDLEVVMESLMKMSTLCAAKKANSILK